MKNRVLYLLLTLLAAIATVAVLLLMQNITRRKQEARGHVFAIVDITEQTVEPEQWGRNYPLQYESYLRTVDVARTRHGGSEAFDKLEARPVWRLLWAGYPFAVDFREERGHAYMLSDQAMTRRVTEFKQPGACLHCHSSVLPAYRELGRQAGSAEAGREQEKRGFELGCAMPYGELRKLVAGPIGCLDCHTPGSMRLRVTRPGFLAGIAELAASDHPLPQFASIERWRAGDRARPYDPNALASTQELRSFVCGQCHVEYYFQGAGKLLTYPWSNGPQVDQVEAYYDAVGFADWTHEVTGAPMLKAQHPEFEMWSQGIHSRSGVTCADCHMPYRRVGAVKVSDHHVRSPLLDPSAACQVCHSYPETELAARAAAIQDRTVALQERAEQAVASLVGAIEAAIGAGATTDELAMPRRAHRRAQWRLDYVWAENSSGFHAPQEAMRIIGEAIDFARVGEVAAVRAATARGTGPETPGAGPAAP